MLEIDCAKKNAQSISRKILSLKKFSNFYFVQKFFVTSGIEPATYVALKALLCHCTMIFPVAEEKIFYISKRVINTKKFSVFARKMAICLS